MNRRLKGLRGPLPKLIYTSNAPPIRTPAGFFFFLVEINKLIQQLKGSRIAQAITGENNDVGGLGAAGLPV